MDFRSRVCEGLPYGDGSRYEWITNAPAWERGAVEIDVDSIKSISWARISTYFLYFLFLNILLSNSVNMFITSC